MRDGIVDGSNSPSGMCVMFDGSHPEVEGGYIKNVEAVNCVGCFSGYPANGLEMDNVMCASPMCLSDNPPRRIEDTRNLWTAGNNENKGLNSSNIVVQNSHYYNTCESGEINLYWEAT